LSGLSSADRPSADAELGTDHLIQDIGRRSLRGGALTLCAQAMKILIQLGTLVVLARLLPPAAFGLIAMVGALTALLDVIKEFGFSAVTIQKAEITHAQVSALFWLNTAAGAVIALAVFLAAPALARFYDQPELVEITRWMAISFALSGPVVQHWALLRRQMRFGALAAIETGSDIAGFAAAIGVALAGGDYWALVAQRLVYGLVGLIAAWWLCRWRPGRPAPAPGLGEMVRFGGSVTGCYLATVFSRSIDQVVIGWLWGPAILGAYERATKLLMVPLNSINGPVYSVGMPALSRLVDQEQRYRALFRQMVQKLAMLTMPVFALMAVTSDWVVQIVFGPQWSSAAPIAMFASLAATYMPVAIAVGQLAYQSQNRTREMLRATFVDSILCIVAILSGLPFGAVGVAAAAALAGLFIRTPVAFWLATRRGPVRLSDLYSAVTPAAVAAIVAAATVWSLRQSILSDVRTATEGLALAVLAGLFVITLTLFALPSSRYALLALRQLPGRLR
jgi:PST family polysaccharide transporter